MGDFFQNIVDGYHHIFYDLADPRCSDWFLMGSPVPVILIAVFYVFLVKYLGPRLMTHRKAFDVDGIIRIYNLFQIGYCCYMINRAHAVRTGKNLTFFAEAVDYSNSEEAVQTLRLVWYFFMLKFIDLLDTVFFVLRKKNNQITFLHIYHHTLMFVGTWMTTKFVGGGHGSFVGYVNCYVHVIMYGYYFVTATWPKYRKNLWWKKYITQVQLLQFVLVAVHTLPLLFVQTDYPKVMIYLILTQNLTMIKLFTDFYRKAYMSNKKSK